MLERAAAAVITVMLGGSSSSNSTGSGANNNKKSGSNTGNGSKFGTLKARLKDYMTTSGGSRKQSNSFNGKTLPVNSRDKNRRKTQLGNWEPKADDYESDSGNSPTDVTRSPYISSYISFAGPRPYTSPKINTMTSSPGKMTSSSGTTNESEAPTVKTETSPSTFQTFIGFRRSPSMPQPSRTEVADGSRSETGNSESETREAAVTAIETGTPRNSVAEMPRGTASNVAAVTAVKRETGSEFVRPTRSTFKNFPEEKTEFRSAVRRVSSADPNQKSTIDLHSRPSFTREHAPVLSTFRTSGSLNVPSKLPASSGQPTKMTDVIVTAQSSIALHSKYYDTHVSQDCRPTVMPIIGAQTLQFPSREKTTPGGDFGTFISAQKLKNQENRKLANQPDVLSTSTAHQQDDFLSLKSTSDHQNIMKSGSKDHFGETTFERVDREVKKSLHLLHSIFAEQSRKQPEDFQASKEEMTSLMRHFVADSQSLVSSATQSKGPSDRQRQLQLDNNDVDRSEMSRHGVIHGSDVTGDHIDKQDRGPGRGLRNDRHGDSIGRWEIVQQPRDEGADEAGDFAGCHPQLHHQAAQQTRL